MHAILTHDRATVAKHVAEMFRVLSNSAAFRFDDSPLLDSWFDVNSEAGSGGGLDLDAPDEMALHAKWESDGHVYEQVLTVGDLIKARLKDGRVIIPSDEGEIAIQAFILGPMGIDVQHLLSEREVDRENPEPSSVTYRDELHAKRSRIADQCYEAHNFGLNVDVKGHNGWESTSPGTSMSRTVYVERVGAANDEASEKMTFTVVFASADSAELAQAFAMDAKGEVIGHQGASDALNDAQRLFLTTYSEGDFAHIAAIQLAAGRKAAIDRCGDTLVRFFMTELASSEDCRDLGTAVERIDLVHRQVMELASAFEAATSRHERPRAGG